MGGVEDGRRQLALIQRLPHQLEPARPSPDVQVDDAGLARHQPAHVRVTRHPQQLIEGGLAGAVVADGQLADSQTRFTRFVFPAARGGSKFLKCNGPGRSR